MNKLICITGLCGAGKSLASDYLVSNKGCQFFRFGQITLDEIKKRGLQPNEQIEREVREEIRSKYGMGAFALLNLPKIQNLLGIGHTVGDGLYSFEEYKILKDKFGSALIVIAVFAPPPLRYSRLEARKTAKEDTDFRNRTLSATDAKKRDYAELENLNKGATIAMADFTIQNTSGLKEFYKQLDLVISAI